MSNYIVFGILFLLIGVLWYKVNEIAVAQRKIAELTDKWGAGIEERLQEIEDRLHIE